MTGGSPCTAGAASIGATFELIVQVARKLQRIERLTMQEADLTPAQFGVLSLLWERDRQPFKDLAEAQSVTRATMTGLVDGLEKKGLVERQPNPADRRSLLAALTRKGRGLRERVPDLDNTFRCCCRGLSKSDFGRLQSLLEKLDQSLVS